MDNKELKTQMDKDVKHCVEEFGNLRGSKANPGLIESLEIDQNGGKVQVKHIGMVTNMDNSSLKVDLWNQDALVEVEKAIRDKLQLNPARMGTSIKVTIPPLSGERRQELVKTAKDIAEKARVVIRNIRRDALDKLKTQKKVEGLSEDMEKRIQQEVQKIHDQYIKEIDEVLKIKEKTILE